MTNNMVIFLLIQLFGFSWCAAAVLSGFFTRAKDEGPHFARWLFWQSHTWALASYLGLTIAFTFWMALSL